MPLKDKLTKKQVFSIPRKLEKKSIGKIAGEYGVTWNAIWYWVGRLRNSGIEVKTRPKGCKSKIL